MNKSELRNDEYAEYYSKYIALAPESTIGEALVEGRRTMEGFLDLSYAPGKWTIKEVLGHLIDTERVFSYRALRIARKDQTPLSGFDHNSFVDHSEANDRSIADLKAEYLAQRQSTILLFKSMTEEMALSVGVASENQISVRALGYIQVGHELHHLDIIKSRYLTS